MVTRFKPYLLPIGLILVALFGALLIFYSTNWGPWAYSDSSAYLASARNLIHSQGFGFSNPDGTFGPFTYYPPLYPLLLAIPGLLRIDMVLGARLLDVIFFGLTILVLTWGSSRFYPDKWGPFALGFLLLSSITLVDDFSSLMSEPSFILTGFSGLVALLFYIKGHNRLSFFLAALLTSLAMLSRYIGFTFLITAVLTLLFFDPKPLKKKLGCVAIYILIAAIPTIIAQGWVYLQNTPIAGRNFLLNIAVLGFLGDYVHQLISVLNGWLPLSDTATSILPPAIRVVVLILIGLILFILTTIRLQGKMLLKRPTQEIQINEHATLKQKLITGTSSSRSDTIKPQFRNLILFNSVMILFIGTYMIGLGLSYSLSSPPVAIDNRMLSPLLPAMFSLVVGLVEACSYSFSKERLMLFGGVAFIIFVVIFSARNTWNLASRYHADGKGYTASVWHQPHLFDPLLQIPKGTKVISNDPALILFYLNRFPYDISNDVDWTPTPDQPTYGQGEDQIQQLFKNGAWMVLFMPQWEDTFGTNAKSQLAQFTKNLEVIYQGAEFQIYRYPAEEALITNR